MTSIPMPWELQSREKIPSRIEHAEGDLRPDSLVGSYFHSDAERGWQGMVVAEIAPSVYLVETFSWLGGYSYDQRIVPIGDMSEWHFYDTQKWMDGRYRDGVDKAWQAKRATS